MGRVVIDPVTRVGGHLRIEAQVDAGAVSAAWSAGTSFRGLEAVLAGRDPRDAWLVAQRICGACTGVHALASVRAVERALRIQVPRNARLVRNVMAGARLVQEHVSGFYQGQALDWADAQAAAGADPSAAAALAAAASPWPNSSTTHFSEVRDRLASLFATGRPGPFTDGPWGHPAYRLEAAPSLVIVAHAFEALDWRRQAARIQTILGGKGVHPQTFLVGGMALAPAWGGPTRPGAGEHPWRVDRNSPIALSSTGLAELSALLETLRQFVEDVYVPDVLAVARAYPEWASIGAGPGHFLSWGEFPEDEGETPGQFVAAGRVMGGDLRTALSVDPSSVAETVAHAHYDDGDDDRALRSPEDGRTRPAYGGPIPPFASLEGRGRYSWVKAPRYEGEPMEVGPLARIAVAAAANSGDVRQRVSSTLAAAGIQGDLPLGTVGRLLARAIEAQRVAVRLETWLDELRTNLTTGDLAVADITRWNPEDWPADASAASVGEGPRGAVGHWVRVRDGRIAAYQVVDASTWNVSPRDAGDVPGPLERALASTPVADELRPLELLRTIHSFDPCPACAVHAWGGAGDGPTIAGARR